MPERDPATGSGTGPVPAEHTITEIIAEFSEVFAFARTRWAWYAEEVHPDLKGVGMMVLQTIMRKGPVTATGLCQMLDMDKAVVSRQVAKLRQLDLVEAEPSAEDRRVTLLTISPAATTTLDGIRERIAHAYREQFAGWTEAELEVLRAALHRFNGTTHSAEGPDWPTRRCGRTHHEAADDDAAPREDAEEASGS